MEHSPKKPQFTAHHRRTLQQVQINAVGPGTIGQDFAAFLDFFAGRATRVTGMHQLPLKILPELNARLTRPLVLGLQRPQQKSYPHLEGLYLLLRASGLTYVTGTAKQLTLMVDEEVRASWQCLNPTERYGTLLETWLLRGHPEIVGEDRERSFWIPQTFEEWTHLYMRLPDGGTAVTGNQTLEGTLYFLGLRSVALLELFGLLEVEHLPPTPGQGWQIGRLRRTAWGDALCGLFYTDFFEALAPIAEWETAQAVPQGVLQPVLQPYFPAWEQTLQVPTARFRDGVYLFRAEVWSDRWRRIALPAECSLDDLADAILDAYRFDHDHLYMFTYQNRSGREVRIYHPLFEEERLFTDTVRVGDLPLRIGQSLTYLFDFGDQWIFTVTLEDVAPSDSTVTRPVVRESHGKAPQQYGG